MYQGCQDQNQDQILWDQIAILTKIVDSLHQDTSPPQNQYTLPLVKPCHQSIELCPQPHEEQYPQCQEIGYQDQWHQ